MITSINEEKNKIIKSFFIIGLDEFLIQKYEDNEKSVKFIQEIDILIKDLPSNYVPPNKDEKWMQIRNNAWLRMKYTNEYKSPITDFLIVSCDYESPEYLLLEKKYIDKGYYPIMVTISKEEDKTKDNNDYNSYPIINEFKMFTKYSDTYVKIPSNLNLKEIVYSKRNSMSEIILISREFTKLPIKDIIIQRNHDNQNGNFNFGILRNKSPYLYKYIPEILDQYPPSLENNSSVSMFCFPKGIEIRDQYKLPIWFTFVLTDELGERTYGSTLIFWEDIDDELKESFVPKFREIDTKTQKDKYYFIPKAICILSKYPFYYNCLLFLKQLYRMQISTKSLIPLERAICTFVDSLYLQKNNEIVQFILGEEKLNFYRISNYGDLWDTNNKYLEVLFRVLSFDQIVTAWLGLLLEKKLFLLCSSKATLSYVVHALINLLFPFKWIHVLVPILPEKLKLFIDSPVPLIIGICYKVDLNDFPNDALILNINENRFENYYNQIPKLRGRLQQILERKLKDLKEKYYFDNPIDADKWMDFQDEANPSFELNKKGIDVDVSEIRDAFYSVFISMFKNYEKFIDWEIGKEYINKNLNDNYIDEDIFQKIFKKKYFFKDLSCNDEDDFINLFSETSIFNQFLETFLKIKPDGPMAYFLESIKNRKSDKKYYLPLIIPEKIRTLPEININDLKGKTFFHKNFPIKLDTSFYTNVSKPKAPFKSKFLKFEDEWCNDINKLKKRDWTKYLLYSVYEIWFHFFSFIIHFYGDKESLILMDYALFLLEDLINNKKITPTRTLFSKLFKSCGKKGLSIFIKKILLLVNKIYKNSKFSNIFHNSYLSGLYSLTENNVGSNNSITLPSNNSYLKITSVRKVILNEISLNNFNTKTIIDNILYIDSKICPNCILSEKKLYKINPEHILAGFNSDKNKIYMVCPHCLYKIEPNLFYLTKSESHLNINKFKLIPMHILIDNIDSLINQNREIFFYKNVWSNKSLKDIYLSIIFYFQLFDLPLFVLYTPKDDIDLINEISQDLQLNKLRKIDKKGKRKTRKSISPDRLTRSPDRLSKSPDRISDNRSGVSRELTEYSRKSTISNVSELENKIWTNIKNNSKNNEILSTDKISSNEKNEYISKYKDIKAFLNPIIENFILDSKAQLELLLNRISENKEGEVEIELTKKNNIKTLNNNNKINIGTIDKNKIKKNEENIKTRNLKSNLDAINFLNNNNLEKIKNNINEEEKEENKLKDIFPYEGNNNGTLEQRVDEKKKNTNLLDVKEENIALDMNIHQGFNSNKNIKHLINSDTQKNDFDMNKNNFTNTTSDKNKNFTSSKDIKINEFEINDKTINNNSSNASTKHNESSEDNIRKALTSKKKTRTIKIHSENFYDE